MNEISFDYLGNPLKEGDYVHFRTYRYPSFGPWTFIGEIIHFANKTIRIERVSNEERLSVYPKHCLKIFLPENIKNYALLHRKSDDPIIKKLCERILKSHEEIS